MVIYSENAAQEEVENVVKRTEHTMLTNFFALNQKLFDQQDPSANKYTYLEILRHYTWKPVEQEYIKRKQNMTKKKRSSDDDDMSETIGRIPVICLSIHTQER